MRSELDNETVIAHTLLTTLEKLDEVSGVKFSLVFSIY